MSNKDYKAYLLSKNKADESNLKSYKKQYETALGKAPVDDENAKVEINLNDNMIDEEQVDTELTDLLKQYLPNIAYLTQVVGDDRLSNENKYDLVLNFQTFVEPRLLAIKNKKISVQRMVAFLVQIAKELKASSLNVDIDNKLTDITGALRSQIDDFKGKEGEASLDELIDDLVRFNKYFMKANNIARNSANGLQIGEIRKLIKKLASIDRSYHNFYKAVKKVKEKFRNDGYKFLSDDIIDNLKLTTVTSRKDLQAVYENYFDQVTTQSGISYPEARMIWEYKREIEEDLRDNNEESFYDEDDFVDANDDPFEDNPLQRRRQPTTEELRARLNIPVDSIRSSNQFMDDLTDMNQRFEMARDAKKRRARRARLGTWNENLTRNEMEEEDKNITDAYLRNPKVTKKDLIHNELKKKLDERDMRQKGKREKVKEAYERYNMQANDRDAPATIRTYQSNNNVNSNKKQLQPPASSVVRLQPPILQSEVNQYPESLRETILNYISKIKEYNKNPSPSQLDINRAMYSFEQLYDLKNEHNNNVVETPQSTNNLDGGDNDLFGEYSGYGLRKKKSSSPASEMPSRAKPNQYEQQLVGGKYFINRKKLSANVLEIRYTKNRHLIPIKSQIVGKSLRTIIEEIIDNNNLDKAKYEKLTKLEQNLLRSLLPYLGRDIDDVDDDEAFYDRFDVIRGQLLSGNDNKMLKREAKQYLMHALNTGKISRTHFNQMIIDLDL